MMKKVGMKSVALLLSVIMALLLVPVITFAVGGDNAPSNPRWDGNIARWDEPVNGAPVRYIIYLYKNEEFATDIYTNFLDNGQSPTDTYYDFTTAMANAGGGEYKFSVVAQYADSSTDSSEWSQVKTYDSVEYQLTFSANTGTGTMSPVNVKPATVYTFPECTFTAPFRGSFQGWSFQNDLGAKIVKQPGETFTFRKDTIIKAEWGITDETYADFKPVNLSWDGTVAKWDAVTVATPVKYQVTVYRNGDEFVCNRDTTETSYDLTTELQDKGVGVYAFYVTAFFQTPVNTMKTSARSADLEYGALKYTISWDANGGTGTKASEIISNGTSYTFPECTFTAPSGKQFLEWRFKNLVGDIISKKPGETYVFVGNAEVYAVWENIPYTPPTYTYSATMESITFDNAGVGYTDISAKAVKVNVTGTGTLNTPKVKKKSGNTDAFNLNVYSVPETWAPGEHNTSWYVSPVNGLEPGYYEMFIEFTADELEKPVQATVSIIIGDHVYDTNTWLNDSKTHWNPCVDSYCSVRGNEAAHDSDEIVKDVKKTFSENGYSGDTVCSVCGYLMAKGEVIPADKYILEANAYYEPSEITDQMSAGMIFVSPAIASKYSVEVVGAYDETTKEDYPLSKNFVAGHKYSIYVQYTAVAPYEFDTTGNDFDTYYFIEGDLVDAANSETNPNSTKRRMVLTAVKSKTPGPTYTGLWDDGEKVAYYEYGMPSNITDVRKINSDWYNLVNGVVTAGPTAAENQYGWWYIGIDGKVDFTYKGFVQNGYGTWYCENGYIDFEVNGIIQDPNTKKWGYVKQSKLQTGKATVEHNDYGWWYIGTDGFVDFKYNGTASNSNGTWYIVNGKVDFSFTGFAAMDDGTGYFEKGKLAEKTTGVVQETETNKWGYVVNGKLQTGKITVQENKYGWWYIGADGYVDFKFNGFASNQHGYWYIVNGKVDFKYTGLAANGTETWYVKTGKFENTVTDVLSDPKSGKWANVVKGKLQTGKATVAKNSNGWWYIGADGYVDFKFTGFADNEYATWYCKDGHVDFKVTGVVQEPSTNKWGYVVQNKLQTGKVTVQNNSYGWWYIGTDGYVDFTYDGLASNTNGTWYIVKGKVDFSYTGTYTWEGKQYKIVSGKVQ